MASKAAYPLDVYMMRNRSREPAPRANARGAVRSAGDARPRDDAASLLNAVPILDLLDRLKQLSRERRACVRIDPAADALDFAANELSNAIVAARRLDLWVGTSVAAVILGISPSAVGAKCRKRQLKARKVGGDWFVWRPSLDQHAEEQ